MRSSPLLPIVVAFLTIVAPPLAAKLALGVDTNLWATAPADADARLDRAASLGVHVVRFDAPWKAVEVQKGVLAIPPTFDVAVDGARKRGIEPMLILDYGNAFYDNGLRPTSPAAIQAFAKYAEAVVRHFKGRVRYYEIWNEWNENNGNAGIGTPDEYLQLVRAVYPIVKRASPEATFLVGATSRIGIDDFDTQRSYLTDRSKYHFLSTFLKTKGLAYGDALSIHPYVRDGANSAEKIASYRRMLTNITRSVAASGRAVPLFVTEVGWATASTPDGQFVTETDQAQLAQGIVQVTCQFPNVRALIFYALDNTGGDPTRPGDNYGLFGRGGRPKPAVAAIKNSAASCR